MGDGGKLNKVFAKCFEDVTGSETQIPVSVKGRRTLDDAKEPRIQNKQMWTLNRLQNIPLIAKKKNKCLFTGYQDVRSNRTAAKFAYISAKTLHKSLTEI
jgi:hypothetical protein